MPRYRKCLHWFFLCAVVSLKTETQHMLDIISSGAGVMNEGVLKGYKYSFFLHDYFFHSLRGIQLDLKRKRSTTAALTSFILFYFIVFIHLFPHIGHCFDAICVP